ncbi:MAG: hypothetical protein IPH08_13375 [Rhodocyclaceae bacterium]|nr:hypothetical protein [Rhodocyclaceae bacterium]
MLRKIKNMRRSEAPGSSIDDQTRTPEQSAAYWWRLVSSAEDQPAGLEAPVPRAAIEALAQLVTKVLTERKTLLLLVPDDEFLPAFSSALDISLRPLCLVLPSADFAARIAMRATLSLMKSRLSRNGGDEHALAWANQMERINTQALAWRDAQEWNSSNARRDWPTTTPDLFPVRILPVAAYRAQARKRADIAVCFCCDPGTDAAFLGDRLLYIGGRTAHGKQHAPTYADEAARLRAELAQLTQEIGELELELATAQAEMTDFTHRYYRVVGRRMTELDVLKAKLARRQLEAMQRPDTAQHANEAPAVNPAMQQAQDTYREYQRQADRSREESARFEQARREKGESESAQPFRPSSEIKRMFRHLAQRIHPDRAVNEADRAWRTQLMSEANRAYRAGNADALREVATLWEEGGGRGQTSISTATGTSAQDLLRQQIATMRERFEVIRGELHSLFGSRLYELFLAARQIGRYGRDMLQELADKLDTQIKDVLAALRALGDTADPFGDSFSDLSAPS